MGAAIAYGMAQCGAKVSQRPSGRAYGSPGALPGVFESLQKPSLSHLTPCKRCAHSPCCMTTRHSRLGAIRALSSPGGGLGRPQQPATLGALLSLPPPPAPRLQVVLVDVRPEKELAPLVEKIKGEGGEALAVQADVADKKQVGLASCRALVARPPARPPAPLAGGAQGWVAGPGGGWVGGWAGGELLSLAGGEERGA